ncbi:tryptophan-rich sensory protein [Jannaschia aquimarina]|nr:tryptophan-rich sensory protein [Jannaschia aquimarina]
MSPMTLRAAFVLILSLAFAASPLFVPDFGGYDPMQFPVPLENPPVQPAGYAFAIWGLIYLWLIASAAFGLWKRGHDVAWDAPRIPLGLSLAVGAIWLPVAVVSPIWATVLIWAMLIPALWALARTPQQDLWLLRAPIGLYAGWLTAASSVSIGLVASGWDIPPFGPSGWAVAAVLLALMLASIMLRVRASLLYGLALVWALVAVTVRNGFDFVGILALVGAVLILGLTLRRLRPA